VGFGVKINGTPTVWIYNVELNDTIHYADSQTISERKGKHLNIFDITIPVLGIF